MKCPICFIKTNNEICDKCSGKEWKIKDRCFICLKPINNTLENYTMHGNACQDCNVRASNVANALGYRYKFAKQEADEEVKKLRKKYKKISTVAK